VKERMLMMISQNQNNSGVFFDGSDMFPQEYIADIAPAWSGVTEFVSREQKVFALYNAQTGQIFFDVAFRPSSQLIVEIEEMVSKHTLDEKPVFFSEVSFG
jgi:hypothetical protein